MDNQEQSRIYVDCLLASYNASLQMATYEATLVWNKVAALLVADSVLVAITSQAWAGDSWLMLLSSVLGIVTSIAWIVLVNRGVRTFQYWLRKARQDEELVSQIVQSDSDKASQQIHAAKAGILDLITQGKELADNRSVRVRLPISKDDRPIQFNWVERRLTGKRIEGWIMPFVFFAYFFAYFCATLLLY
jgi:hypothetical protein